MKSLFGIHAVHDAYFQGVIAPGDEHHCAEWVCRAKVFAIEFRAIAWSSQ
jgi:hypothetical protein